LKTIYTRFLLYNVIKTHQVKENYHPKTVCA